jgi:hypothetical protein
MFNTISIIFQIEIKKKHTFFKGPSKEHFSQVHFHSHKNSMVVMMNWLSTFQGCRCGHDRMVVGFTTTCAISAYHH